jgi:hypothetical protein
MRVAYIQSKATGVLRNIAGMIAPALETVAHGRLHSKFSVLEFLGGYEFVPF